MYKTQNKFETLNEKKTIRVYKTSLKQITNIKNIYKPATCMHLIVKMSILPSC